MVDANRGDDRGMLRHDVLQDPAEFLGAAAQDDRARGEDVPVTLGGYGQTVQDAEKDRGAELQEPCRSTGCLEGLGLYSSPTDGRYSFASVSTCQASFLICPNGRDQWARLSPW